MTRHDVEPEASAGAVHGGGDAEGGHSAGRRGFVWAASVLFGLYLLGRIAIVSQSEVFTSFDTFSYAYRDDPAWDRGALVSFSGQAPRPWGAPLFFALFGDDFSRAVGQWAVGTLAWAFLAWSLSLLLRHSIARLTAIGAILLIGLSRTVSSWDFAILSESLSISLGVAVLAFFLWWLRTRALLSLAATVVVAVWWIFTRVDMFVLSAPIGAAFLLFAWRQRSSVRARNPVLAGAAVLALAAGWSYAVVGPTSLQIHKDWSFAPELTHERGLLMYRLRISVFSDPAVKSAFERELGMPPCAAADQVVQFVDGWALEEFAAAVESCPPLQTWTQENAQHLWTRYATKMPLLFARQIGQLTSDALTGAAYANTPAIVPAPLEKLVFPRKFALPLSVALVCICLVLALASGARRAHPHLLAIGIAAAATALASAVVTVVVSSGEVWRFGIQEAIALRIAILILICVALDALLARRATTSKR